MACLLIFFTSDSGQTLGSQIVTLEWWTNDVGLSIGCIGNCGAGSIDNCEFVAFSTVL